MGEMRSDSARRVALVTGATGTIGGAIARGIASREDFEVVLAGRDEEKGRRAATEVSRATSNDRVRFEIVDVSRHISVKELAKRWQGPLHVLVNNAAVVPRTRQETPEGIELQFATNVLGYFWMTSELVGVLGSSTPSRVINVASYWAGDLDLSDLEFKRRRYSNGTAYRQSKQADRMLAVSFAERLRPTGISVNACHPGDAHSNLSHGLGFGGHESPEEAARTPVWLAVSEAPVNRTGKYFAHQREEPDRFADDRQAIERLHEACQRY